MDVLFRFFDRANDLIEIGPIAGVEFGMEQFAIGANLEGAAARGNQRERFNALAELEDFSRQTDGFRRVVSDDAIFDGYFGLHRASSFPVRNYRCDPWRSRNARSCASGDLEQCSRSPLHWTAAFPLQQNRGNRRGVSPNRFKSQAF